MAIQKEWSLPGNLEQVMRSMTYREYLIRLAWIDLNWDAPNRSDYYLMQIAQEVRRVLSKKSSQIRMDDFRVKFVRDASGPKTTEDKKKTIRQSKASWFGVLGITKDPNKQK